MKIPLRSDQCTVGRRMAGARALWVANGMKKEQMGKPIIAIANSFTQFVPGHVHLHEAGQIIKKEIERLGCFAAEFNTIAVDDGIAMGHDGMLYSLPSRDIIADSVEYMVNAHKADALVCISNCDKITPGMLMATMRLNIPTVFVSGGPMEAGELGSAHLDLIDAMIKSADDSVSDADVEAIERSACPGCGCCSGMFTANSMNCLTEVLGLALPGNGTILATHKNRIRLFKSQTAFENVLIATHLRRTSNFLTASFRLNAKEEKAMREMSMNLLEEVGLTDVANELATSLPYGKQRRLEIARALATDPTLLLLDEPAAGMNPQETDELGEFIVDIKNKFNLTVFMIEHHMNLVMDISDRIYVLDFGKQIAEGTPEEIQKNPVVIAAYLGVDEE